MANMIAYFISLRKFENFVNWLLASCFLYFWILSSANKIVIYINKYGCWINLILSSISLLILDGHPMEEKKSWYTFLFVGDNENGGGLNSSNINLDKAMFNKF